MPKDLAKLARHKARSEKMYASKVAEAESRAEIFMKKANAAKAAGKDNSAYVAGIKANKTRADAFRPAAGTPSAPSAPGKPKLEDRPKRPTPKDFPTPKKPTTVGKIPSPRTPPKTLNPQTTTWKTPGGGRGGPPKISEKRPSNKR